MKTYKEFIQNLEENKLTRYMAKKVAKQAFKKISDGMSTAKLSAPRINQMFSGKKSEGAQFLKKSAEGQNIRQKVAKSLRGDKGIGTTHSIRKNTPEVARSSEFQLSKLDKQMDQMAGRFVSGAKSGELYKTYQSPNVSFKRNPRATARKAGGGEMLKQYDDLAKKSYEDIKPSDAANQLKRKTISKALDKKLHKSGLDNVEDNVHTLQRHQRMRGMSKKRIRNLNKRGSVENMFVNAFLGRKTPKRVGPTKHHRLRAQDTAIMKRPVANSDTGRLDLLGGPESMRNYRGKPSYASIEKGKIPQPKGSKKTKTPNWVKSLNRYDDDFEFGKVDVRK